MVQEESNYTDVSIIIPAKNEENSLSDLLDRLNKMLPGIEILVIDDGSSDATAIVAESHGAVVVLHPYSKGNGAAIKTGAREAKRKTLLFMDADGQHDAADVSRLIAKLRSGYDMVVGARKMVSQANVGRGIANRFYNMLAGYITGQRVEDLTSGFRAVRAERFKEFIYLLPNGFSYPTTITMAFFRAGYSISYEPIRVSKRVGDSHIRPVKDGVRFFLIIFKVGTMYSPLKLFAPLAVIFFVLGLGWYGYTYTFMGQFTNMSALLMTGSLVIFVMGLISEQITTLMYK